MEEVKCFIKKCFMARCVYVIRKNILNISQYTIKYYYYEFISVADR